VRECVAVARTITTLCAVVALLMAVPAGAVASYDNLDEETLNDVNSFGQEVPYTSGQARQFTASFDTSGFTLQPGEGDETGNVNGCRETEGDVFAGKTGWVRFNPDVAGKLHVIAQTPSYDSIVWIRESRETGWKTASFSDVRGPNNCSDVNDVPGDEETTFTGLADRVYFVQVGGKCAGGRASCDQAGVPGGPTTIRLTFTPDDTDSDGVPNTLEGPGCEGAGEKGKVTADGCPDTDQDGVKDSEEGPGCVGQKGVPAAQPYNGCFDGPTPPTPDGARVTITSSSGDPDNTSSVDVRLRLNWPKGAREAFANNGANDADVKIPLSAEPVPWRLRAAAKSETREVVVTFKGPNINAADDDIITLDPAPPSVRKYVLSPSGGKRWYVGVRAADDRNGSGVSEIEVLDRKSRVLRSLDVCAPACRQTVKKAVTKLKRKPRFLRVTDAVGNRAKKPIAVTSSKCSIRVYERLEVLSFDCFKPNDRCHPKKYRWSIAKPALKCQKPRGGKVPRVRYA
jgi:hypothetical protein